MTGLERTYRALVRLFPRDYRTRRGEELVGTLLDAAGSRRLPRPGELADLLRAAAVAWFRAVAGPTAAPARRDGLAYAAGLALVLGTALADGTLGILARGALLLVLLDRAVPRVLAAVTGAAFAVAGLLAVTGRSGAVAELLGGVRVPFVGPSIELPLQAGVRGVTAAGLTVLACALVLRIRDLRPPGDRVDWFVAYAAAVAASTFPAPSYWPVAVAVVLLLALRDAAGAVAAGLLSVPVVAVTAGVVAQRLASGQPVAEAAAHWEVGVPLAAAAICWAAAARTLGRQGVTA